jgi:hypothetical protein
MGVGRYVISALGAFNRSGRRHDQEADGKSNGGEHNRNNEEVVGERQHADLQSAGPQGNGCATVAHPKIAKNGRYSSGLEERDVSSGDFFPGSREKF